jgi:hypothetical protein
VELTLQRIGAWCGTIMIVLYGASFAGIAQLFPPLSPAASADEIAAYFVDHKLWIRSGVAAALLSAVLVLPFLATVILRIRRVEGGFGMLSMTQLLAAAVFAPALMFPQFFLGVAAYRPEKRSAELTQAFNDVFWLWFTGIVGNFIIQFITLAIAAFIDKTDSPTFPRWYGYLNLWVATLTLPGCAVVLFNDGPLAWNGVFAFYIPALVLGVWLFCTTAVLLKSIKAEQLAESSAAPATA